MRGRKRCAESQPSPHLSEVRSGVSSSALTVLGLPPPTPPAKHKGDALLCLVAVDSCSCVLSQGLETKAGGGDGSGGGAGGSEPDKSLNCRCSVSTPSHVETREA